MLPLILMADSRRYSRVFSLLVLSALVASMTIAPRIATAGYGALKPSERTLEGSSGTSEPMASLNLTEASTSAIPGQPASPAGPSSSPIAPSDLHVEHLSADLIAFHPASEGPVPSGAAGAPGTSTRDMPRLAAIQARPVTGTVNVLNVPVYFPDMTNTTPRTTIEARWQNATDYYEENSYGQLHLNATVYPWICANDSIAYYAYDDPESLRLLELYQFVFQAIDPLVDFRHYHHVFLTYAGADAQNHTRFWPLVMLFQQGASLAAGDGIAYANVGFVGENTTFGTYCHEFGHALGLPDLYNGGFGGEFVGYWALMGAGNYNGGGLHPAHMCAWSKLELGWITPAQVLEVDDQDVVYATLYHLEGATLPAGQYYALKMSYSSFLYYLLEFRDDEGYDAYLPDSGLLWAKVDLTRGSAQGIVEYLGASDYWDFALPGVELDAHDTEYGQSYTDWLRSGSQELAVTPIARHADHMTVLVDRVTDRGFWLGELADVEPGEYGQYAWNDTVPGDVLWWVWDVEGSTNGADFFLYKDVGAGLVEVFHRDDIYHDGGFFRVEEAGNYTVRVLNDNVATNIDVYSHLGRYTAPLLNLTANSTASTSSTSSNSTATATPMRVLRDHPFNLSLVLSNEGLAWDEAVNLTVILSSGLVFPPGTGPTPATWSVAYHGLEYPVLVPLNATATGLQNVTVTATGRYATITTTIPMEVIVDVTKPRQVAFLNPLDFYNRTSYTFLWHAIDDESGITSYALFVNDSPAYAGTATGYSVQFHTGGVYEITLFAYDLAGNFNQTTTRVVVDFDAPVVVAVSPARAWNPFNLTVRVGDNASGVAWIYALEASGALMGVLAPVSADSWGATLNVTGVLRRRSAVPNTTHYTEFPLDFFLLLQDHAGNQRLHAVRLEVDQLHATGSPTLVWLLLGAVLGIPVGSLAFVVGKRVERRRAGRRARLREEARQRAGRLERQFVEFVERLQAGRGRPGKDAAALDLLERRYRDLRRRQRRAGFWDVLPRLSSSSDSRKSPYSTARRGDWAGKQSLTPELPPLPPLPSFPPLGDSSTVPPVTRLPALLTLARALVTILARVPGLVADLEHFTGLADFNEQLYLVPDLDARLATFTDPRLAPLLSGHDAFQRARSRYALTRQRLLVDLERAIGAHLTRIEARIARGQVAGLDHDFLVLKPDLDLVENPRLLRRWEDLLDRAVAAADRGDQ